MPTKIYGQQADRIYIDEGAFDSDYLDACRYWIARQMGLPSELVSGVSQQATEESKVNML